jgi:hypothetical protein
MIKPLKASGRTTSRKGRIYVADWRYGADYAYSTSTDTIQSPSDAVAELFAYKHNTKAGVFIDRYSGEQYASSPRFRYDLYFQSDRWNIGAGNVIIPDYYASAWTSAGASAFGVTAGQPKEVRYPNHGQQLYDLSGGVYGFDFNTNTIGSNNLAELYDMAESDNTWFFNEYGRYPSAISWRNGQDGGSRLLDGYYLGGRNSESSQSGDSYSKSGVSYGVFLGKPIGFLSNKESISTPCSVRYRTMGVQSSYPASIAYLKSQLSGIASNKGRYHNFFHWHFFNSELALIEDSFEAEIEQINAESQFCWNTTFGEIYEYIAARESVGAVWSIVDGSDLLIKVRFVQRGATPTNRINTPVTIIIDTTGTPLAGSDIECLSARGIRKISANIFAIDIDFSLGLQMHTLSSTISPSYYNFNTPAIVGVTRNVNDLVVETDIPVALSVFKGTSEISQTVVARVGSFSTSHTVPLISADFDNLVWVGIVTAQGQSILSIPYDL